MTIHSDVHELQNLNLEMKRLRQSLRTLGLQRKRCEDRILEYLQVNKQPGLQMDGFVVVAKEKTVRKYQKKSERALSRRQLLDKYGLTEDVLDEVLEGVRPPRETRPCLEIKL